MEVLGVDISAKKVVSRCDLERVCSGLNMFRIVTLNPEILLHAHHDGLYQRTIENAQAYTIDGVGLAFVLSFFKKEKVKRYSGAELLLDALALLHKKKGSVFFILPDDSLSSSQSVQEVVTFLYPDITVNVITVRVSRSGARVYSVDDVERVCREMKRCMPDMIFCTFGAPHQDFFLAEISKTMVDWDCIAVGVGGAVDFLTGKLRRAPLFMQKIGLEWFWRFILEPKRWRRMWRAVIVFPYKILISQK